MLVERSHDAGEVKQRAAEPVDIIDHHAIDLSGFDVGHEPDPQR
jgi:hypothetical protein